MMTATEQSLKKLGMAIRRTLTERNFATCQAQCKEKSRYQFIPLRLFKTFVRVKVLKHKININDKIKSKAEWFMCPQKTSLFVGVKMLSDSVECCKMYIFEKCKFKYCYGSQLLRASYMIKKCEV